jgi:putative Mn2+ efflux pump MntP
LGLLELFLLAVGLSMDTFAVAVCFGLTMKDVTLKKSLTVGLYFGIFQAVMPLLGYLAANSFTGYIIAYSHWIVFVLLCFIGGKMIAGGFKKEGCSGDEVSLKPAFMLPFAFATSVDALAVGVSFAFLRVNVIPAVVFIGIITFALSIAGLKIGNLFGLTFKSKAEFTGGVILILVGVKILLERLL